MPCRKYLKASVSFPGCRKEGQAQILIGCLGLGGWGRFPDPRLDKGGKAKSLTCVTWGRPPESAICKGERSELSRVHSTPCLALTYLHRLCDQTYCPAPALAGPTGSGGPGQGWGAGPHLQEGRGGRVQFGVALNLGTRSQLQQSKAAPAPAGFGKPLSQLLSRFYPQIWAALLLRIEGRRQTRASTWTLAEEPQATF